MANSTTPKKRLVASFRNLPSELQEAIKQKYPLGFSEAMMRIDKPNGEFFTLCLSKRTRSITW